MFLVAAVTALSCSDIKSYFFLVELLGLTVILGNLGTMFEKRQQIHMYFKHNYGRIHLKKTSNERKNATNIHRLDSSFFEAVLCVTYSRKKLTNVTFLHNGR